MEPMMMEELLCPVCLELLCHPVLLSCSHLLCRAPCATRLLRSGAIQCPICRQQSEAPAGLASFPQVLSLENILTKLRRKQEDDSSATLKESVPHQVVCQLCHISPQPACNTCIDCRASYCLHCLQISHPNKLPFSKHKLVEPSSTFSLLSSIHCEMHGSEQLEFCRDCWILECMLCARKKHENHHLMKLSGARKYLEERVKIGMDKLENKLTSLNSDHDLEEAALRQFLENVGEQRRMINSECDSLISEIEKRRAFFLSDLQFEERSKSAILLEDSQAKQARSMEMSRLLGQTVMLDSLILDCGYVQFAMDIVPRIHQACNFPASIGQVRVPVLSSCPVDFRKERTCIRNMSYLRAPRTPSIDLPKCSRSVSSVVIVLKMPETEEDVLDGYKVFYSLENADTQSQKTMIFTSPREEPRRIGSPPSGNAVCLMHQNLQPGSKYLFSVNAYNSAGESGLSETVVCTTLQEDESDINVPVIDESKCQSFTSSLLIHSDLTVYPTEDHSPNPANERLSCFLVYREADVQKIWKSVSLLSRTEHRIFNLESNQWYELAILATNLNGQCRISHVTSLKTQPSY